MDVLGDVVQVMRTGRPHANRTVLNAPWRRSFPAREAAGFHVVLRGGCEIVPADGAPVGLTEGDVAFLPRGTGHTITGDAATVLLCGAYDLDLARPHPLLAELPRVVRLPADAPCPSVRAAVGLLDRELDGAGRPGAPAALTALLDLLLLYLLRAWHDAHAATGWSAALRDPAVGAALRAVHADPARDWTVETLGAEAGLSRAAFARRFTGLVGRPPLGYLTWWRMSVAARLLRGSDLPLRAVAARVGYTSEYAFGKAFKRELGVPPGAYRAVSP
jgi:AraC-like DNA-binding protein